MNNSSRGKLLFLLIVSLLLVSGCGKQSEGEKAASTEEPVNRDSIVLEMVAEDSLTVFEILQENHTVDFKSSLMGIFVRAIDSLEHSSNAYWLYSVNGEMPKTACDKYVASAGDTIRWHLRKTGD